MQINFMVQWLKVKVNGERGLSTLTLAI